MPEARWSIEADDAAALAARSSGVRVRFWKCGVCGGSQEEALVGDPHELVPADVWDVMKLAALLERGLPALPEAGGWEDQPAAFLAALELIMAERQAVRSRLGLTMFGGELMKV